jgi:hypothetical protein
MSSQGTPPLRTRGWWLIQIFYLLLLGVSGVGLVAPSLTTREGRWGVGLALANLALVILGSGVTWFAYRPGQPGHGGWFSPVVSATAFR